MLKTTILGPEHAQRSVVLLHGLLASGRNLRSFARGILARCPTRSAVLLDLPGHGETSHSQLAREVTTVAGAASAVVTALAGLPVDVVIGHSFGGKVAFEVGKQRPSVEAVWLLDSSLGTDPEWRRRADVGEVIRALARVPMPAAERGDVLRSLVGLGLTERLAEWMTTNLARAEQGYEWVFDLAQIEALTDDYFAIDLLSELERRQSGPHVHVVRAERGERYSDAELATLERLARRGDVSLHTLARAGHWVHADNLPGLLDIVCAQLS